MLPLRDENPHPPGFKPKVTISLIIVNVIVFFFEVAYTGQFFDFSNQNAFVMFYNWGAVPGCITGQFSGVDIGGTIQNCPAFPELTLLTSTFMHGGLLHLGGNLLFLWIFGDNIELKFGKIKFLIEKEIIEIPLLEMSSESEWSIPMWTKAIVGWWNEDKITDDEFLSIIKNLVEREIIII